MSRYETRYSQFGLISGVPQPASDMVLVVVPPGLFAPEARKGQLMIVADIPADAGRGRDTSQLVLRTIRKAFYEDSSLSVTSSLRKAVIAANRALYQYNFSAAPQKRGLVGVTCAVLKDGDLYVAQVAPAQLFLLNDGRIRALPASAVWESSSPLAPQLIRMRSIGATLTVEPELYRAVLRPGDGILLCTSSLTPHLTRDLAQRLLSSGDLRDRSQQLIDLCGAQSVTDAHGILVSVAAPLSAAAQAAPLSAAGITGRGRVALQAAGDLVGRATGELTLLLRGPVERLRRRRAAARGERAESEQQRLQAMPDLPQHSPDPPPMPRRIDIGETLAEQIASHANQPSRQRSLISRPSEQRRVPPSSMLGEPGFSSAQPSEQRPEATDWAPTPARSQRQTIEPAFDERPSSPIARLNSYFARTTHARRMRSAPKRANPQAQRMPGLSYRRETPPFPWVRLLVLVSLVMILLLYGVTLSNQNQVREVDTGLATAERAVALIFEAPDEDTARQRLEEAAQVLASVQATGTITSTIDGRQRFEVLQREFDQAETSIHKISYFEELEEVARNPQPGAFFDTVIVPPLPKGITNTLAFDSFYMLDANTGVLYRQPKSGGSTQAILRPQDSFGPLSVGRVLGALWRFDTIVAVAQSSEGGPYSFYFRSGETWSYSILAGSDAWGLPGERFRIANYEGNLYVWGADPTNILRYRSGEYGNYPDPWVQDDGRKSYESTLDIAVDGKIYMLQPNGHVLVFASNDAGERAFEREIVPDGIDPPLSATTRLAITGDPESGFIFLVDGFYSRIIQLDKRTGAFIQQIKAKPDQQIQLDKLISVAVDTSAARPVLYIVNGSQILRAALPDPPRDFRSEAPGTPLPGTATPGAPTPTQAP